MSPDARVLWEAAAPALVARGFPLEHGETAEALAALCLCVAMDHRIRVRLAAALPGERRRIQSLRDSTQRMARSCAWALGLLPIERIEHVPRDAAGADVELGEFFSGVDHAALVAAVQAAMSDAAAWRDALEKTAGADAEDER
jgi:hypothetical protein